MLNVLFPKFQSQVLMQVSELLKPTGSAFFAVRRDVHNPGFRWHKLYDRQTYQCNVVLPFESVLRTDFCEIYRYRHFNQINGGTDIDCPFCSPDSERNLITESAQSFSIEDKYAVSEGHALVIPKRHVKSYFDLADKEQMSCWLAVNREDLLSQRYDPDGFNVGINDSSAAGQTVEHAHFHVIPRYEDDVNDPVGGVRNVIPEKGSYIQDT